MPPRDCESNGDAAGVSTIASPTCCAISRCIAAVIELGVGAFNGGGGIRVCAGSELGFTIREDAWDEAYDVACCS